MPPNSRISNSLELMRVSQQTKGEKMKKTITLEDNCGPCIVLCPGHVSQKDFNNAFKGEGWSERGGYKQADLRYEYWIKRPTKRKDCNFNMKKSIPGKPGAKPYTATSWD